VPALNNSIGGALAAGLIALGCTGQILPAREMPAGAPGGGGVGGAGVGGTAGAGAGQGTGTGATIVARPGLSARLGKFEYENSIADVLGVKLTPEELDSAAGGIPDDTGDGVFKHLSDKQTSVEQHPLAYSQVAEKVAARLDVPALAARLGVCTAATTECRQATVAALGRRLYRRPLTQREVDAMMVVFSAAVAQQLDHAAGVRWVLQAMLQSPPFLFHLEDEKSGTAGQARPLGAHELAARLASFLWVSVPDDALLARAADGSLVQPDVLSQEITRMLADPKALRFTQAFIVDFSRARFAAFDGATDADRAALNESVIATFQDHLWTQRGSVADLFVTQRFIVNARVAQILGVSMSGTGLQPVNVGSLPERVGLMSHPGVIAGMGDRAVGSFVNRGKYLMERLLCRNPIAVPASLQGQIQDFNETTAGMNEIERAAVRKMRAECWSCHTQFEPFAFGFARFDGAGRYVGDKDADGKPLPLDGWVPTDSEAQSPHYSNFATYMQILATNPVVQTCMTEHFIEFATARPSDPVARAEAARVGKQYIDGGSTLPAMVAAVAESPLFRTILTQP
jgi:hypothetical protein